MRLYRGFLRNQIRNYVFGSTVAVLAVGSLLMLSSLEVSRVEYYRLLLVLVFSFVIMVSIEIRVFLRQIRPIRAALVQENAALPMLEEAYLHTHQLPKRAIQRIMGPHLLGLSVPALLLTFWMIHAGWVTFPYIYLILAMCCAVLVACMHSLIEFFLTWRAMCSCRYAPNSW